MFCDHQQNTRKVLMERKGSRHYSCCGLPDTADSQQPLEALIRQPTSAHSLFDGWGTPCNAPLIGLATRVL